MSGTPAALLIVAAVAVLACGALLSAAEAALSRMTRAAAEDLVEEGRRGAQRVLALAERRSQVLGSVTAVRVAVDMLAAVLLTLAVAGLVSRWWLVLIIAVGLNAVLLGLVVGLSPRSAGRRNPAGSCWRWPALWRRSTPSAGRGAGWRTTTDAHPPSPMPRPARR